MVLKFYKICHFGKLTSLYLSILGFWKSFSKFTLHPFPSCFGVYGALKKRFRDDLIDSLNPIMVHFVRKHGDDSFHLVCNLTRR